MGWQVLRATDAKAQQQQHVLECHFMLPQVCWLGTITAIHPQSCLICSAHGFISCRSAGLLAWFKGTAQLKELPHPCSPCKSNWMPCASLFEETVPCPQPHSVAHATCITWNYKCKAPDSFISLVLLLLAAEPGNCMCPTSGLTWPLRGGCKQVVKYLILRKPEADKLEHDDKSTGLQAV